MKRLSDIKKEKELAILEAEREEEFLTNGLQRKLNEVLVLGSTHVLP
jgi:hypothetical protein